VLFGVKACPKHGIALTLKLANAELVGNTKGVHKE